MSTISELRARVEAATGADLALSFDLARALLAPAYNGTARSWFGYGPHYTSSLDAALALVERVLPGWQWRLENLGTRLGFNSTLSPDASLVGGAFARGPTPALALLSALLAALEARADTPSKDSPHA